MTACAEESRCVRRVTARETRRASIWPTTDSTSAETDAGGMWKRRRRPSEWSSTSGSRSSTSWGTPHASNAQPALRAAAASAPPSSSTRAAASPASVGHAASGARTGPLTSGAGEAAEEEVRAAGVGGSGTSATTANARPTNSAEPSASATCSSSAHVGGALAAEKTAKWSCRKPTARGLEGHKSVLANNDTIPKGKTQKRW